MARYASEAAGFVVPRDLSGEHEPPMLLTQVGPLDADESVIRAQLVTLHDRILAEQVTADDPAVDATWALWQATHQTSGDPEHAWKVTVSALLRDPRMMFY